MKEKNSEKKKWPLWLRILLIFISVIVFLFLALFAAYHMILDHYLGMIQYESDPIVENFETELLPEDIADFPEVQMSPEMQEEIQNKVEQMAPAKEIPIISDTEDITNILLMGEDKTGTDRLGTTDVMMLVSINTKTKKILMCSFLRDLYLKIPSDPPSARAGEYDGLNDANYFGGPMLTLATIKEHFNLDIQYYAKVNFKAFANVVDAIGGVEVSLSIPEIENINAHHKANAIYVGGTEYPIVFLPLEEGEHKLNGAQALTYARIRNLDSDWKRTGRQRKIVSSMLKKVPDLSLGEMMEMLEVLLPQVSTNIPQEKLKKLIAALPAYSSYPIEQATVPADQKFYEVGYYMVPDLQYNQFYLYEKIMGYRAEGDPR